ERLSNRMPELKIAVIETVTIAEGDNSWKTKDLDSGNLLLLVNELPPGFIKQDNEVAFSKAVLKKRRTSGVNCGTEKRSAPEI
ncbi:MAG: hypothetical protein KAU21_08175, partial [Gammaproteobacteria bacterium]|nr:hypothetical protein [Gammaproteobacteria bacterium]